MKISKVIEWLSELPQDYDLCYSAAAKAEAPEGEEGDYLVILDCPVVGYMVDNESREIRLMVESVDSIDRLEELAGNPIIPLPEDYESEN